MTGHWVFLFVVLQNNSIGVIIDYRCITRGGFLNNRYNLLSHNYLHETAPKRLVRFFVYVGSTYSVGGAGFIVCFDDSGWKSIDTKYNFNNCQWIKTGCLFYFTIFL